MPDRRRPRTALISKSRRARRLPRRLVSCPTARPTFPTRSPSPSPTSQRASTQRSEARRSWSTGTQRDDNGSSGWRRGPTLSGATHGLDISLTWDTEVSRVHAEIQPLGSHWLVVDDGLSRNGTWLNGARVSGRQRLNDGDTLRFGNTLVAFSSADPDDEARSRTRTASELRRAINISPSQRRVLVALVPSLQGQHAVRDASDQPADRRRALPQRRRGQDPSESRCSPDSASRTSRRTRSAPGSRRWRSASGSCPTRSSERHT